MAIFNALKVTGKALAALKITEKVSEGVIEMTENGDQPEVQEEGSRTVVEEIEVEAKNLIKRLQELIHEGNIRTLRVKDKNGKYLIEIPLTMGVVAGGVFALQAPWAVALSALAGFVVDVKVEIIREEEEPKEEVEAEDK